MSHHYIICYDICCNRRRYQVDKVLAGYGERMQLSVYECRLTEQEFYALRAKLRWILDGDDKINYYPLCTHCQCRRHTQGIAEKLSQQTYMVI